MTGASTGIGAALAMEAVKHGAKVAITARFLSQIIAFGTFELNFSGEVSCLTKLKTSVLPREAVLVRWNDLVHNLLILKCCLLQILVLPLDLCDYSGHKAAFDKVISCFFSNNTSAQKKSSCKKQKFFLCS